jgi:hypothetical protein
MISFVSGLSIQDWSSGVDELLNPAYPPTTTFQAQSHPNKHTKALAYVPSIP